MKEKIVIIGANSFQNCLILKAKELGYETHVFAWQCGDIGEKNADFFYPISIVEKELILQKCKEIEPKSIISIGSDLAVLTVNYVARKLQLIANSEKCDTVATNKFEMRKAFINAGIPTPNFLKVKEYQKPDELQKFRYPLIVKPTDRSGSRGITKINKETELEKAILNAIEQSFERAAIIEEFIEGSEYSCECISYKGKHHLLAITKKYTTGAPHFIEIGHIQPAIINKNTEKEVENMVFTALDTLDIKNGASHTEFKIDIQGNIRIIEVGARMGGDCIGSDLVYLSTGNDFLKMVIDVSCGREPEILKEKINKNAAIRFIMQENDLNLLELSRYQFEIKGISQIDMSFDHKVIDSSTRYGYFLVTTNEREVLEKTLFGDTSLIQI